MGRGWRETMREVAAMTTPSASARDRLRARLDARLRSTGPLLRTALAPPPTARVLRLRLRLGGRRHLSRRPWPLIPAFVATGAFLATLALVVYRFVPEPSAPVAVVLASGDAPVAIRPVPEVSLVYRGNGAVGGDSRQVRVAWESGDITVEVEPGRGVGLSVSTDEAEVRVVGTGFFVRRDALGTTVRVSHGEVEVACARGSFHRLYRGDATSCLPTTPAALLGRARALEDAAAPPDEILHTIDLGLAGEPSPAVRGELLVARVQQLAKAGRADEALAAAEQYLALGGPRAEAVRHIAARLAYASGGCARAADHLAAVQRPTPELVGLREQCAAESR